MTNGGVLRNLTLSDDVAIESILTTIPLFCVGIFSIGVFTFLISLKRVNILSIYLFVSSFFSFIAAILDLGQILIRGYTNAINDAGFGGVAGFIRAREVLLALSTGTLFVFFWTFVGDRPIGIPVTDSSQDARASRIFNTPTEHCGSWGRWGYIGLALKWVSLLICVLVGILQIVWRVAPQHHRYADLYVTSGTLETTISAIFILKILLNFYLTPATYHRQVLLGHIVPVLALLANGGLGVGNLVLFSFSETTLGRFLRAVEVYTLIVYFLIVTFRPIEAKKNHKSTSSIDKPRRPLSEKVAPGPGPGPAGNFDLRNPAVAASPEPGLNSNILRPWNKSRSSALSKVSSWLSFEPFTSRMQGSSRDPETALPSSQDKISMMTSDSEPSLLFRTTPEPGWVEKPKVPKPTQEGSDFLKPPVLPYLDKGEEDNRPLTDISLSYYAMENDLRSFKSPIIQDTSSIGSDSPVYGLDGIIPPRRQKPVVESIIVQPPTITSGATTADNLSPIEELLQQQSELDRSISALRGLHNRQNSKPLDTGGSQVEEPGSQVVTIPSRLEAMTPSSIGATKPSSTSAHSDSFSLSGFPDPPAVETPKLSARTTLRPEIMRARVGIIPIRIPGVDIASAPNTPSQIGVTANYDSAVTQYDVTSFIGDLTGPNSSFAASGNAIATSSFYTSALSLSDDDNDNGDRQSIEAPKSEKSISPTSSVRTAFPPSSATSTTPPAGRGLGKATMSSAYKAKRPPIQKSEPPTQAVAAPTPAPAPVKTQAVQPPYDIAPIGPPFLARGGSARAQPPVGPRVKRSGSLSRTQTGAGPMTTTTRF